ncbi:hypothetical protein [Staphylococcus massiliensis]|uniref:Uncharacterized protein n=1 Tax=Staphylococcus massiliensis S46 TaxID=1229783 RepID=K9AM91_9STAP|nr:hypothetical protein [Staphylococcus massiliensis]EKU48488.1 hypothetical protein C273_04735 [Staphylococcus massiliensis S46]MCG3400389.1 hypothetical protein [Staphylococcus massiliensis]MCG3401764.1 hypothetical protein [Staphylococcus massiliensis]MCG3412636.1 hypothetical protein [Staphylococcus massiliensis]POA01497.1 hypothetical protein CD133_01515 [Staphylococcus massiliensis CCUG 55927]
MSRRDDEPEVIDPDDPRYRRPEDSNRRDEYRDDYHREDPYGYDDRQRNGSGMYYSSFGCMPFGCGGGGCLISIILSILLTLLLNAFNIFAFF